MIKQNLGDNIAALPESVIKLHGIKENGSDRGLLFYNMHGVFDFWSHHIQRILYDGAGYEIVFSGLYVWLDEKSEKWELLTRM